MSILIVPTSLPCKPAADPGIESSAGVGDNPMDSDGMSAIYFYIMDKVQEWYNENAEEVFEEWKESQK